MVHFYGQLNYRSQGFYFEMVINSLKVLGTSAKHIRINDNFIM